MLSVSGSQADDTKGKTDIVLTVGLGLRIDCSVGFDVGGSYLEIFLYKFDGYMEN